MINIILHQHNGFIYLTINQNIEVEKRAIVFKNWIVRKRWHKHTKLYKARKWMLFRFWNKQKIPCFIHLWNKKKTKQKQLFLRVLLVVANKIGKDVLWQTFRFQRKQRFVYINEWKENQYFAHFKNKYTNQIENIHVLWTLYSLHSSILFLALVRKSLSQTFVFLLSHILEH